MFYHLSILFLYIFFFVLLLLFLFFFLHIFFIYFFHSLIAQVVLVNSINVTVLNLVTPVLTKKLTFRLCCSEPKLSEKCSLETRRHTKKYRRRPSQKRIPNSSGAMMLQFSSSYLHTTELTGGVVATGWTVARTMSLFCIAEPLQQRLPCCFCC